MRRTALLILGAAGALVALLLIAVAIAVATVDPNRFVAPLAARVKAETGRTLAIGGPVDISVSLEPKIVLPDVSFGNAPWSKTPQMLTAKRIEAQIALLPLLSRRFEVIRFTLVEPTISLETDAAGHGNWGFSGSSAPTAPSGTQPAAAGAAFGVGNLEIQRGTLTYRNGASGKVTVAAIDRFSLRARDLASPAAVDFRGTVDDVPVALEGELGPPSQWLAQQWPYPLALKGEVDGQKLRMTTKIAKSATTTTLDDLAVDYGPIVARGRVQSTTQDAKTRYTFALDIPVLSLAALPGVNAAAQAGSGGGPSKTAGSAKTPAQSAPDNRFILPDAPLPLGVLGAFDGEGTLAIGTLELKNGQKITGVTVKVASTDAKTNLDFAAKAVLGGSLTGQVDVDMRRTESPAVRLQLAAQELDLPKLAAAAGIRRDIRGGKVRASVDISGRGTTPHAVASTMSGTILIVAGPATLARESTQEQSAASQVAAALDPCRSVDTATELRCAVVRLPLANGVANVDRSIGLETAKIAASASGTLDFRNETLDLSVKPQIREGINVDVSQLAGLVRVRGPFAKPAVAIDAAQTAQMIAKLGILGAQGGGIEALGRALIAPAGEASSPCAIAQSGKAPREAGPAPREAGPASRGRQAAPEAGLPKDVGREVGKALGKLLGR
jgi:uncharacterized protein involved in outer membrane biogenesis